MKAVAQAIQRGVLRHPQVVLGLMLLALHGGVAWGSGEFYARALLLAHFGLFLLWQPVWRGERTLEGRSAVLVTGLGLVLAAFGNWWLLAVWIAALVALIGGNVTGSLDRRLRLSALLAAVYLLALLLVWVVPHLFVEPAIEPVLVPVVRYGLPLLALAVMLVPVRPGPRTTPLALDLIYSLLLFLLVGALVLGSFAVKQVSQGSYLLALAQTLFAIAVLLAGVSWLWNPRGGFGGFGNLLSRYVMSLGMPFERWVQGLADLAERDGPPEQFINAALLNMDELPWVSGAAWETPYGRGEVGRRTGFLGSYGFGDLKLSFFTRSPLSPALVLHLKLLTQMLGHFYEAKRREQLQRQNAYTQAIYETGARLTHDVKNLLQSLHSLCAAAESSGPQEAEALQGLIRRQLPQIAQRLNATMEKLKAPQRENSTEVDAARWWEGLQGRYVRHPVDFEAGAVEGKIPGELFESVAENLLQNALVKAQREGGLEIRVTFDTGNGGALAVCDGGAPVPKPVAARLLDAPVPSQTGLGIGLYQAALQAKKLGYELRLAVNEPGRVCFELARAVPAEPREASAR